MTKIQKSYELKFGRSVEQAYSEMRFDRGNLQRFVRETMISVGYDKSIDTQELESIVDHAVGQYAVRKHHVLKILNTSNLSIELLANTKLLTKEISEIVLGFNKQKKVKSEDMALNHKIRAIVSLNVFQTARKTLAEELKLHNNLNIALPHGKVKYTQGVSRGYRT